MKNVVLLGSTGSIGTSTAMVARDLSGDIRLVGLAAGSNTELLASQALQFRPELVSIGSPEKAAELRPQLDGIRVASGDEGLIELATLPSADIVLIAIVGTAGLQNLLATLLGPVAPGCSLPWPRSAPARTSPWRRRKFS